jgi:hypothetical protein
MITIMGIRVYMGYRQSADVELVKYNVDVLFQAMARYFQANCDTPQFVTPAQPVVVVTPAMLRSGGYLTDTLPPVGMLDTDAAGPGPYITQFNQVRVAGNLPQRMINISPSGALSMGSIILWRIQVSVNLVNQSAVSAMLGPLGGHCLSGLSGSAATPCAFAAGGAPQLIAWERLPSFASSKQNSPLWQTMPVVKQFKQMYTTRPILILLQTGTTGQYYVCGG